LVFISTCLLLETFIRHGCRYTSTFEAFIWPTYNCVTSIANNKDAQKHWKYSNTVANRRVWGIPSAHPKIFITSAIILWDRTPHYSRIKYSSSKITSNSRSKRRWKDYQKNHQYQRIPATTSGRGKNCQFTTQPIIRRRNTGEFTPYLEQEGIY
jgi:hypothetical protein